MAKPIRNLERALEACRRVGWRSREGLVLGDLAGVLLELGEYETAQRHYSLALTISREVSDRGSESVSLDGLGLIEQQLGRHAQALALFEQALPVARGIGDRRGEAYVLTHLGYSFLECDDLDRARSSLQEAIALRDALADRIPSVVDDLVALAHVELAVGQPARAFDNVAEALDRLRQRGAEGVEYPVRDYLICYEVLQAVGSSEAHERAARALADGYALLQKRAASINDPSLRESYLTKVPFNRELAETFEHRPARP